MRKGPSTFGGEALEAAVNTTHILRIGFRLPPWFRLPKESYDE